MERITSSIQKTPEVAAVLKRVRAHYGNALKEHSIMARATAIGLSVLDADPAEYVSDNNNEEK